MKRWLLDFTDLDEAVPQDVVLWNRLLVMAVVLGVSDQVIEKLGVITIGMNRLADRLDGTVPFFLRAEALPSCRSAEMVVADEQCSYRRTKRNDCEET